MITTSVDSDENFVIFNEGVEKISPLTQKPLITNLG